MDEIRLAVRRLRHRSAATVVSIAALAAAIGAAAATWSLLSAVLLKPLPVRDDSRVVVLETRASDSRFPMVRRDGFVYPVFSAVRDSGVFGQVAAEWTSMSLLAVTRPGEVAASTPAGFVTCNYFDLLGVPLRAGRTFTSDEDRRGAVPVAIITDAYWSKVFDRDPAVIGRTIAVAGKPVTIVGVAAPRFRGVDLTRPIDLYLPFHTIADVAPPQMNYFADPAHDSSPTAGTRVLARLRDGGTIAEADARLAAMRGAGPVAALSVGATPIQTAAVPYGLRAGLRQFGRLLGATVALLLMIGCMAVGMLLLVRTEARRDELALCVSLGASRARLAAGIVLEGVLLTLGGAAASIPVAWWLFAAGRSFQLPGGIDIGVLDLRLDLAAVAGAAAASLAAGMLIAVIAATFAIRIDTADALRGRAGVTPRLTRRRTRATLAVAQVAVALVLVAGATLFARSLAAALGLNASLDMRRVMTGSVSLTPYGYTPVRARAFFDDVSHALEGNAAIASLAYSVDKGGMGGKLAVDGVPTQFASMVRFVDVDSRYFRTLGIGVRAGRDFTAADRPGAPMVAIASASMARALESSGAALGRRITMPHHRAGLPPDVMEIVGVVDDLVTDVSVLEPLTLYFPEPQSSEPSSYRTIVVRVASSSDAAAREVGSAVARIDAAVARPALITLEDRVARQMSAQRLGAVVLGALGTIAVLLTVLGIYVLAESLAVLRMREMGIRAALGATRRQLGAIVLADTGRLVGLGLLVGLLLAWAGAGTISAFLFQIRPLDPATLLGVALAIFGLALAVSLRPAVRAARVDLASILKAQ